MLAGGDLGEWRLLCLAYRDLGAPSRLSPPSVPSAPVKFHVTTFGCQMNEHDSERMKGMLESLGYAEVPDRERRRPDPVQHLLDPREGRRALRPAPLRGARAQAARPGAGDRRRRLLGAVGEGAGVPAVPVRRRRLRPRPGPQARRVPDERLADRPGLLRVRGLHRPSAGQARARLPGLGADLGRLQHAAARSASCRPRAAARSRGRSTSWSTRSGRLAAEGVREVTLLGQNVNSYGIRLRPHASAGSPSCCTRSTRSTASTGSATRARTRRTCARTSSARTPSCRASASTSTCRCSRAPRASSSACAAPTTAQRYLDRVALIREHVPDCALTTDIIVGFPGETEADFAETLEVVEEVGFDGAFTFIYSPRRGTEAAAFTDDFIAHEVAGGAHGAARRGRPAPRPRACPALRRPHARRARRGRLAPRPVAACAAAPRTTRSSTSTASRRRARSSRSRSPPPRARRSRASPRCSRAPREPRLRRAARGPGRVLRLPRRARGRRLAAAARPGGVRPDMGGVVGVDADVVGEPARGGERRQLVEPRR